MCHLNLNGSKIKTKCLQTWPNFHISLSGHILRAENTRAGNHTGIFPESCLVWMQIPTQAQHLQTISFFFWQLHWQTDFICLADTTWSRLQTANFEIQNVFVSVHFLHIGKTFSRNSSSLELGTLCSTCMTFLTPLLTKLCQSYWLF